MLLHLSTKERDTHTESERVPILAILILYSIWVSSLLSGLLQLGPFPYFLCPFSYPKQTISPVFIDSVCVCVLARARTTITTKQLDDRNSFRDKEKGPKPGVGPFSSLSFSFSSSTSCPSSFFSHSFFFLFFSRLASSSFAVKLIRQARQNILVM